MYVKPKKALGQHFLNDEGIASRIVESLETSYEGLQVKSSTGKIGVLEVGPGTGVLSKYLLEREDIDFKLVDVDTESIEYLRLTYPEVRSKLMEADFLQMKLEKIFPEDFMVIGNFPYNISSQIFFKILDYVDSVPQVVGMVQKEVAERLASPAGNKAYGILSVLLQAWYDIEYLFTVDEHVFTPPPKVKSAVIRLRRNSRTELGCDSVLFKAIIKSCFNQRRKTIRNSIRPIISDPRFSLNPAVLEDVARFETTYEKKKGKIEEINMLDMRPEQLSVEAFIDLTNRISSL